MQSKKETTKFSRVLGSLLAMSASAALLTAETRAADPKPVLLKSIGQEFRLVKNWTFGNRRADATVRNKAELDQEFCYRYIWDGGKLDKFNTYWSYHRDYPEGDAKSLHVFSDNALTLKGRIPPGGGLRERGIEAGMLRGKVPVIPGMYIEMRARLSGGVGAWPSFWLEQGVQYPDGTFSPPPKPLSEIDIFEFFNWDGRPQTRILTGNIQTFGSAAAYGHPHDLFTTFKNAGYERHLDLGFDCSKDFHVFALDWVQNKPIWLLDGKPIKQTYYEWHGAPAHVTVVDSIGMNLPGVKQTQMVADEKQWDYTIDYIRIWERKAGAIDIPVTVAANPANTTQELNSYESTGGRLTINTTGKWENPTLSASKSDAAKLKANPVLKVDLTVPPNAGGTGWFTAKLAIHGDGFARTESPKWLIDRDPGKSGINKETVTWDLADIAATLPDSPNWFKIELVTQGGDPRTIYASNLRAEPGSGKGVKLMVAAAPAPAAAAAAAPATAAGATPASEPAGKIEGAVTIAATGKWESPVIRASAADVQKLKANPVLKVDISLPPDAEDGGWFMAKLAINGPGIQRTESPKWLVDAHPGKAGLDKVTMTWDTSAVVGKLEANPSWFKIELVTQGDHPRTIQVSNLRMEAVGGAATAAALKVESPAGAAGTPGAAGTAESKPAADGFVPYPDPKNEAAWPGKGPIRSFDFMVGERRAAWNNRQKDQGAVVFVGDSLTGGWKKLANDFPKLKVANRGVGGDVSRGALFRFKTEVLDLNPKAIVIEIGNNDLTAFANPADTLSNIASMVAMAEKEKPGVPIVLCSTPPNASPKAPVKPGSREAVNEGIRKMASEHKTTHFCDLYSVIANADGTPKLELLFEDKVHLNDVGHAKWAEALMPIFEKLKLQ